MDELHVIINRIRGEYSHAPPTNVRLTLGASHMITTSVLLDQDLALGTLPDVLVTLSPTLQQPLLGSRIPVYPPLLASEPFVLLPTGNANGHETRSAPENPISRVRFEGVDFWTVRSGAVPELLWIATDVVEEGDFQEVFDLRRNEEPLYDWEGDQEIALPLIAHTRQGELFGVGGGEKEVTKAAVAIGVTTSQEIRLVDGVVTNWAGFSIPDLVLGPYDIR